MINPSMILPASLKDRVFKVLGPVQVNGKHKWVTDALIKFAFSANGPLVSAIWYSDPDGAAHSHGIGSLEAMASIKIVDAEFGRIIDTLESKDLTKSFNIVISTDHESNLPTSNVDLAPTILFIQGIAIPGSMDGRIMNELLVKPSAGSTINAKKDIIKTEAPYPGGGYDLSLERSVIGKHQYVNFARVTRTSRFLPASKVNIAKENL